MASKKIYSTIFFSMLYQVAFGCSYNKLNCTYEVHCSGNDYMSYDRISANYYNDYCNSAVPYNGYSLLPVRLFITGPINVQESLPYHNNRMVLTTIISLDITNSNFRITPTLYAMDNLKMLNLSNNFLQVADLSNEAELIKLQEIDLAHNFIDSIQVNENKYVYKNLRKVNLSYNALTNISGGIFDSFKLMEYLDLSYNNLAIIDQYTFEGLKSLKYLCLSQNSITDINSSLFRFVYLQELYLDKNKIENLLSRDFEKLRLLQKLKLDFNQISRIEKDIFNGTVSLTTINLHHNLLNYINKDAFISTNNLKAIDISNNLLKTLPIDLFQNKSITSFTVSGNNLEGSLSKGIFEGINVSKLDISFQEITAIEDYVFFGMEQLTVLLLNNNKIYNISNNAFNALKNLNQLDLSNNWITHLYFDTTDLLSLQTYVLGKNFIEQIRHDDFRYLKKLNFLDLSNNNITKLEPNTFTSVGTLVNFQISGNPLHGTLLKDTFDGLSLVPILDLSCTTLTTIQNRSFSGMVEMKDLNISRSSINVLEFNAFINTGNIKLVDLAYNKLTDFFVNTSHIRNLTTIYLNNNDLIYISDYYFKDMSLLNKVVISHNFLQSIDYEAFMDQMELSYLDISFNNNLTFHTLVLKNLRNLNKLILSSTKSEIDFTIIGSVPLKYFEISHSHNFNASKLHLNAMKYLTDLVLRKDNIVKIEPSVFRNLSVLERLDLSFNNITFIQPGTFKDNILLYKLNLSHNFLTNLNYGIFRGLINLQVLDVSFNNIHDLKRERFYDLPNINTLLIDHNSITNVDDDFFDFKIRSLSIGHNPLPCEQIIHMKQKELIVSAINIDEHNGDNIDGIICNLYNNVPKVKVDANNLKESDKILLDIKDILLKLSTANQIELSPENRNNDLLKNIFDKIERYDTEQKNITSQLSQMTSEANMSNLFLERILKAVIGLGSLQTKPVIIPSNNVTKNKNNATVLDNNLKLSNLFSEVSQLKQELLYVVNVISEIDRKISIGGTLNRTLVSDKLNMSNVTIDRNIRKSFGFVEICVLLILLILVCFILYKFYQSKMFVSSSRSLSTRHITDAMDNSNL